MSEGYTGHRRSSRVTRRSRGVGYGRPTGMKNCRTCTCARSTVPAGKGLPGEAAPLVREEAESATSPPLCFRISVPLLSLTTVFRASPCPPLLPAPHASSRASPRRARLSVRRLFRSQACTLRAVPCRPADPYAATSSSWTRTRRSRSESSTSSSPRRRRTTRTARTASRARRGTRSSSCTTSSSPCTADGRKSIRPSLRPPGLLCTGSESVLSCSRAPLQTRSRRAFKCDTDKNVAAL